MKKQSFLIIGVVLAVLIVMVMFYFSITLYKDLTIFSWDSTTSSMPNFADSYQVTGFACGYQKENCTEIQILFQASERAQHLVPSYKIKEEPAEAKTEIIFNNVKSVKSNFTYEEILNNPLIDQINYEQLADILILTIKRKGELRPAEIKIKGEVATIRLPEEASSVIDDYPKFSKIEPADNSIVYPSWQKISLEVDLVNPLKKSVVFFQGKPEADFKIKQLEANQYYFELIKQLENDRNYKIKVIIIDSKDQATVAVWEFDAQKALARTVLGEDRFKYLGWWGQINSTTTPVMAQPTSHSHQLATFSTVNRVKVLKEVFGQSIDGNNLWYQIDGGAHPGAYIFSAYLDEIVQPDPPKNIEIPQEVQRGEYWIDLDLSRKVLTLFLDQRPIFATYAAIGRQATPTITGIYRIWYKTAKIRMRGGPPQIPYNYDLPNVPHVLFYYGPYAIHGVYWHDKFGTRQSAGCTNLTQGDAKFIFEKVGPKITQGENSVLTTEDNPGTVVFNHY